MLSFIHKNKISLQICRKENCKLKSDKKRALLYIMKPREGSLVIEAALVIPLFLFVMISLISLISILQFYMRMQSSLHNQTKLMAQNAYIVWNNNQNQVENEIIKRLGSQWEGNIPVKNGWNGLDFNKTELTDREFVKLSVSYEAELPYDVFHLFNFQFSQSCLMHTWIGYEKGLNGKRNPITEEYVYVTEDSEVYHRDRECSHIRLHIREIQAGELNKMRNNYGEKYSCCELCSNTPIGNTLFITEDGNKYHKGKSCSGLKRTVIAILISEIGNRRPCSRCGW